MRKIFALFIVLIVLNTFSVIAPNGEEQKEVDYSNAVLNKYLKF